MAAELARSSSTLVALVRAAALWASFALLPIGGHGSRHRHAAGVVVVGGGGAADRGTPAPTVDSPAAVPTSTVVTATPAAAALLPSSSSPPATPAASSATATTAADTASKKFPLPHPGGGEPYNPAAEVASALPVPTPDELPSASSLGFDGHGLGFGGPGDVCCGGGGYGWFGGPGGYGPGTYGYTGPLYWGAAPAGGWGSVAAANVVVPLVVACVSAALAY
uniref:Uncharacterized protein n=1 Tax=Setaria italica TaxID=4555 RepID=K3ZD08_SETIT